MAKILSSKIPYKQPETENLIKFMSYGLQRNCNLTIITDSKTGTTWTGAEIEVCITNIANYLIKECSLKKGDVCTIYHHENDKVALAILAVIAAGGVCNYLSSENSGREVHDTSKILRSKFIISPKCLLEKIKSDIEPLDIKLICSDGFCDRTDCATIEQFLTKDQKLSPNSHALSELANRADIRPETDYAVIQFSSGTTGKPKPIPRTHKNLCHLVASVDHKELMDLQPGTVITGSLPITNRPGLWALLACINGGSNLVIWSNLSDVADALCVIETYKVTIFSSSLPFLSMLGNRGLAIKDNYDTSSLKHIITSGAKILNSNLPERLIEGFGLESLRQCFGMTESGWVFLIERSLAKNNYLSVGHVVPGTEAVVLSRESDNLHLEAEQRGELALRGPQIFPGYLTDKPGVLNRSDFTEDGWFKIGDQGYYDSQELVFIVGRFKELLVFSNNLRFFPNEIESIISEHPAIEAACVVKSGEFREDYTYDIARACITLKQGCTVGEQELIDFVQSSSAGIVLGGGVKILDKFPRLKNGKVDKQALKQM